MRGSGVEVKATHSSGVELKSRSIVVKILDDVVAPALIDLLRFIGQQRGVGECQCANFLTILNLHFPKLASPILTVATPLNVKPLTPLYFYPFMSNHTKKNKERYRHWRRLWYNYARYPYGIYSQAN